MMAMATARPNDDSGQNKNKKNKNCEYITYSPLGPNKASRISRASKLSKILHSRNFLTPYLESPIYPMSIASALTTLSITGVLI